ncbi:MAG: hypothetical protein NZ870_02160, partial [bacterium]|nr:hypothetical protein [bacterium]
ERIEVFSQNSAAIIDNFLKSNFVRSGVSEKFNKLSRDMGYKNEIEELINAVENDTQAPIPFYDVVTTTLTTFKILESIKNSKPLTINLEEWLKLNDLSF